MKIQIKVTKEILKKSAGCLSEYQTNCAIALAIRDIFPKARVTNVSIEINQAQWSPPTKIWLPPNAVNFINEFDGCMKFSIDKMFEHRCSMEEISFEIDIPDSIINTIGIKEAEEIINRSETLELVK